ncbi:hypothetical protein C8F01DRAFT_1106497, partial [Mycena amicta]
LSQELYDLIVDEFHDSPPDLKSCALVCTSFLPHAQAHLFCAIYIPPPAKHHKTRTGMVSAGRRPRKGARCSPPSGRLLSKKPLPHLLPYVRTLGISFNHSNPEILSLLAPIPFPSLETLHLDGLPSGEDIFRHTRTLVGTPSLLDITLDFQLFTWTQAQFMDLLASFAPGVQKTHLCRFSPPTDVATEPMSVAPVTQGAKPVIRDLNISSCQSLLPMLAAPDGPWDLRSLKTLTLTENCPSHEPIAPLNEFLQSIGGLSPVENLHIICDPERLNLFDLSSLSPKHLYPCLLPQLPHLLAMEYPWDAPAQSMYDSLDELKPFQQLLLHAGLFPHLQKVDVAVVIVEPDPAEHTLQWGEVSALMETVVREELKELEQRGILDVRCVEDGEEDYY